MLRTAAVFVMATIIPISLPTAGLQEYRTPDKDWVKGPVQWLMTKDEIKAYKKLVDPEARAAYVEKFWSERDPTPGTPANEYAAIFWKRVDEAEGAFRSMIRAGAVTDMGRVFILIGPPTTTDTDSRNYQTWTYEPSPMTGIETRLEFRFAPSNSGMLLLAKKDLEMHVENNPATRGIGWVPPVLALAPPELAGVPDPEPEYELTPESQRQIPILDAILARGDGPADVSFDLSYDYYATVGGTTLTVITLEVPRDSAHGSGDEALRPFARLVPNAAGAKAVNLTGDLPFVPAPPENCPPGSIIFQARRNLAPGHYRIAAVVEDKVIAGQMGVVLDDLTIPDYGDTKFDMSSVSLLAFIQPLGASLGPDEEETSAGPYVLGSFRLVPRAVPVLERTDALSFYYQIYNPATDPSTGRPNLEATYSFFLKGEDGWKPFRKPIQKSQGQVELYSIDLKDLLRPDQEFPAEFKMEALLADKVAGAEIKRLLEFTVR